MYLENDLLARWRGAHVYVGFFAHADAIAYAVNRGAFEMGVKSEIIETAVCKAIAIIWSLCELAFRMEAEISYIWRSSFEL